MAKSNDWDGHCYECRAHVRAGEGVKVHDPDAPRGYKILCVECAPTGSARVAVASRGLEAAIDPSGGESKYER